MSSYIPADLWKHEGAEHTPRDPKLTDHFMTETIGHREYVYGRWDRVFSFHCHDPVREKTRHRLPKWQLFDEHGNALVGSCGPQQLSDADASASHIFQSYFEMIPMEIRELVSSMPGGFQWRALEAIWHGKSFVEILSDNGSRNYVLACWLQTDGLRLPQLAERIELNESILYQPRAQLVNQLAETSYGRKYLNALKKADGACLTPRGSRLLVNIVRDEHRAKILSRLEALTRPRMQFLARAPWQVCSIDTLKLVDDWDCWPTRGTDADWESRYQQFVEGLNLPEVYFDPTIAEGAGQNGFRAEERGAIAERQIPSQAGKFPNPPFKENGALRPIRTPKELKREGRDMRHCAFDYVNNVMKGNAYFYQWCRSERATVAITKKSSGDWVLQEVKGYRNMSVSAGTIREIAAAFPLEFGSITTQG